MWGSAEVFKDVDENHERQRQSGSQLDRRNYVRSLWAAYEGFLVDLRESTARLLVSRYVQSESWEIHKLSPLLDETPRLSSTGRIDLEPSRQPFLPLFAYTIRMYAEIVGVNEDFFGSNGWMQFKRAVKLRHRLTHPKRGESFEVTDADIRCLEESREWLRCVSRSLREGYGKTIEQRPPAE